MQRHMTSRIQSKSNQNSLAYVKLPIASLAVLPYNNFISHTIEVPAYKKLRHTVWPGYLFKVCECPPIKMTFYTHVLLAIK